MDALYFLLSAAIVLAFPILAIVALVKARSSEKRLIKVERSLEALESTVVHLGLQLRSLRNGAEPTEAPEAPKPEAPSVEIPPAEAAQPAKPSAPPPPSQPPLATPPPPPSAPLPTGSLEEGLTSRWLVWLGAVAIALAGAFFVKYAVDQGWLGPAVRDSLGFVFGVALALGGEWLRRRPLQRAIASVRPNYLPPSLTAAGIFTAFASIYAAYALHDLLMPLPAFAGLTAVALGAIGLSLLQGWFVALLGLVGGFITPALVSTSEPSAWALFSYLLVIQVACLAVVRYRAWWWLAFAALAGAAAWPLLWILLPWKTADTLPLGLYLLLMAGAFLFVRHGLVDREGSDDWLLDIKASTLPERIGWAAALIVAALFFLLVQRADYGTGSLAFVALLSVLYLVVGRREPMFDALFAAAAAMTLALFAIWPLPPEVTQAEPLIKFGDVERGTPPHTPLVPPELADFTTAMVAFGGLFGIGGFIALWGARRPAIWAGVSAALPVLLLTIAYWRIVDFGLDLRWAGVALALAAVSLFAALRVERYRQAEGLSTSLGFYAAAVVAFISLGATMTLQQAWLTVALSLQLPALAWIHRQVPVRSLQVIAAVVASTVLIRLVFNYNVLDYPITAHPPLNWVLYGYGIPAAMFLWAARLFKDKDTVSLVTLLQAGGLTFTVLLVSLQIRLFVEGSLDSLDYRLLEQSLQTTAWFAIAYVLAVHSRERAHPVSLYGARILMGLAVAQVVILQLLVSNPIFTHEPVGAYPLVNLLFLAYGVPAAFAIRFAVELRDTPPKWLAIGFAGLGFLLIFVYISLEVRRTFQGPVMMSAHQSDAEFQAYSIAWLVYAGVLLALGILRKQTVLRYASLVVLLITVAKVFLLDVADLPDLYRVASLLGLGLSIFAIVLVYQRFVFDRPPPPREETASTV